MEARPAAGRLVERAAELAACSEEPDRLTRRFATPALIEARGLLEGWMKQAGMTTTVDPVGNVRGRCEGTAAGGPALLIGSHIDTVRDAGWWDGTLGVLVGLSVIEHFCADGGRPPIALELIGFADEEGVRYGIPYLGSTAVVGTFDVDWLSRLDDQGVSMAQAIRESGGDPEAIEAARSEPRELLGYVEVHLEQGPVLEQEEAPLGVVSGIVGQSRARLTVLGETGHAGTVPQDSRHDALCAAAEMVLAAESCARRTPGLVATMGELAIDPGVGNSIPGEAVLKLDLRHESDAVRVGALSELRESVERIATARGVSVGWEVLIDQGAVACDEQMIALLDRAAWTDGMKPLHLASGAGHDAAVLASSTAAGMLFVRCPGGISHRPDEWVKTADIASAIEALTKFVRLFASTNESAGAGRS